MPRRACASPRPGRARPPPQAPPRTPRATLRPTRTEKSRAHAGSWANPSTAAQKVSGKTEFPPFLQVSPSVPYFPSASLRFPSASLPLPLHLFSFPSKKMRRFAKNSDSVSVELHPSPFPFPQYTQPKAGSRRARSRTASTGKGTARRCSGATARRRPSTRCSA